MKKAKLVVILFMSLLYFSISLIIVIVGVKYNRHVLSGLIPMAITLVPSYCLVLYSKPVKKTK